MSHTFELSEPVEATSPAAPPEMAVQVSSVDPEGPSARASDDSEDRIELHWSKREERIRAAAKAWLESTHADP